MKIYQWLLPFLSFYKNHGREKQTEACMHENDKRTDEEKSKSQTNSRLRCLLFTAAESVSFHWAQTSTS